MTTNQCDYCMNLDQDQETGEYYCIINMDQDEVAKLRFDSSRGCPYFKMGDDYSIVKKQGT